MSLYRDTIQKATGCDNQDADHIEELMRRQTGGCLDHLRRFQLERLARRARNDLNAMRSPDALRAAGIDEDSINLLTKTYARK